MENIYKEALNKFNENDYEGAFLLFSEGSNNKDPKCLYMLAVMYILGYYVQEDSSVAFRYMEEALPGLIELTNNGDLESIGMIADYYSDDCNPKKDYQKAIEFYLLGIEFGDGECATNLGDYYFTIEKYDIALGYYLKAIELGDSFGYGEVGYLYENGLGCNKDVKKAIYYYQKGAKEEDSKSLSRLSLIYYKGEFVEQDKEKALELIQKAADKGGNVLDCCLAGLLCEELGQLEKAEYYFKLGIKRNEIFGFNFLASLYSNDDKKCISNRKDIIKLYKKAIAANDKIAIYNLGEYYYLHPESTNDYFNAEKLFKDAINNNQNIQSSYYFLGEMNHFGLLGKKDYKKARFYYEKAISEGYKCDYSLEVLSRDEKLERFFLQGLAKGLSGSEARHYATVLFENDTTPDTIKHFIQQLNSNVNMSLRDRKNIIEDELKKDFDGVWESLDENVKRCLTTGIFIYSVFVGMGSADYDSLDFSPIINQLSKAYELLLKKYFYTNYITYLKENHISPSLFIDENIKKNPIITVKKTKDKSTIQVEYYDVNNENINPFSLGSFQYIVERNEKTFSIGDKVPSPRSNVLMSNKAINKFLFQYSLKLFDKSEFPEDSFEQSVSNYLMDLVFDTKTIMNRRNPGSHSSLMNESEAEVCADYLIKVRKIIFNLLKRIKSEKR